MSLFLYSFLPLAGFHHSDGYYAKYGDYAGKLGSVGHQLVFSLEEILATHLTSKTTCNNIPNWYILALGEQNGAYYVVYLQ